MSVMKARRVVLIIVLIIVVIAAILLIKNRETISMLKYMKADQAEIQAKQEQLLEEDAQIKDSLGLSDMEISEEDIAAIESGEKTAEEVAQSIVANTSQQGTSQETSSGDGAASEGTQTSDGTQAQSGTDASSENGGTAQTGETSQSGDTASDAQTSQQDESQARIQTLVAQGYDEFWLNGEYGIPLWATEYLLKLRVGNPITVHIAVPYEEQSTNWTENVRDRYFAVHEQADKVVMVGTQFTVDCYETAHRYMLDRSDALLICGAASSQPEAALYAGENQIHVMYANLQA